MSTASQVSGERPVLETVAELADEAVIVAVFGFSRRALLELIHGKGAITDGLVEKAWEALLLDPHLVSIPQHLLSIASREEIAKDLAAVLARSPYYGATTKKMTSLAHRVTANTVVTRASYYQFEKASVDRVSRIMAEAFASIDKATGPFVQKVIERLTRTPNEKVSDRLLKQIASRSTPEARAFFAQMDSAIAQLRDSFAKTVIDDVRTAKRLGFQRVIDTLHHFEDRRNPWSRLSHPLSSLEMGSAFYTHRQQVLPLAEGRILSEARGLERAIRADISKIITREVFVKGQNPARAAAEILKKYRAQLGERWGGARVSAMRIARTESSYVLNEATKVAYAETGVRYVDVIYTESAYHCEICPPIADGGPYRINEVPEGGIPFHPNCRCTYAAAFPTDAALEDLRPPAKVFGAKTWATELAKYGFVAVTAKRLFGTEHPTAEDEAAVRDVIDSIEQIGEAHAPVIEREIAGRFMPVSGYRRIEPDRFPKPLKDAFREVTVRDPVRAIFDLRKNSYEIGGVIRGSRILYYRGDESSVSIPPVITASGGLHPGDVMFHTHPTALRGYMSSSVPSHADLIVHMHAAAELGDGARHIISGSDGLREIRAEITDIEKWRDAVKNQHFTILFSMIEELARGSVWWSTYGIRRALKNIEALGIGGRLVVSEPTTPGSPFIPLQPYVAPSRVHPAVVAELERRSAVQLRDLYEKVAAEQGASSFRDRDYYVGLLRSLDPSRDWDEAAPTKAKALELLRDQGVAVTGTRFSRDEIVLHLTGQPVGGKVYLDTSRIDYVGLLGVSTDAAVPPVDEEFVKQIVAYLSDEDIDTIFEHVARFHGVPPERGYFEKVAALEEYDPRGSFLSLTAAEIDERLAAVDVSRSLGFPPETQHLVSKEALARVERDKTLEAWTDAQRRVIIEGKPVHGMTLLPDLSVVWWGSFFPGFPEKPPVIGPTVSAKSGHPEWKGRDDYRSPLLHSNRQQVFKDRWNIALREDALTGAWTLPELWTVDYALHLLPGTAEIVNSVSRYSGAKTAYIASLRRLIVGDDPALSVIVHSLALGAVTGILRMGYYDHEGEYRVPGTRSSIFREWLAVEPWRYDVPKVGIVHPDTQQGERAILSAVGRWVQPAGSQGEDPGLSLALAITAYVFGVGQPPGHAEFVRQHIFSGDRFINDGPLIPEAGPSPVRIRRTDHVSLI